MKGKKLPFVKFTSCGNNFVIVDETVSASLSEVEKACFAHQATNTFFGIGCDNLLVVQRCTTSTLAAINSEYGYWSKPPSADSADFVFRMYEPDGTEAFSCGNGLLSVATYLRQHYQIESARVMTEVPTAEPSVVVIGTDRDGDRSWANMGRVRRVPEDMASLEIRRPVNECLDLVDDITIRFRSYDLKAYSDKTSLGMQGYLVFTGEPHLVIFPHECFSEIELARPIFSQSTSNVQSSRVRRRVSVGSWLIRRIGVFLNEHFRSYFPSGVNVNFAMVDQERHTVEYRCFERGIDRETLACGTGAVAVAAVSKQLGFLTGEAINVLPHLCRWYSPDAVIQVTHDKGGAWRLMASPRMLVEGNFLFTGQDQSEGDYGFDTLDVLAVERQLMSGSRMEPRH